MYQMMWLSLAQSATASVSSYGIGISDSYNSAFTMSAITNTVTTVAETNMSEVNSASQSNELQTVHLMQQEQLQ